MLEIMLLSIASYIGTNIDDMIINTCFFAFANKMKEIRSIVLGKYLGTGILILISIIGSLGLKIVPMDYVKYLGFLPICMGVKEWIGGDEQDREEGCCTSDSDRINLLWNVTIVTIANGADNIGVYIPLFTGFAVDQYLIFIFVFVIMTAIWCTLGYQAAKLPYLERMINKYKQTIVPVIYIALGIYILL